MSKARRDDMEIIYYRLDTLERRIESLERTLLSKNDSGAINTELLNIVLNMVRPTLPSVVPTSEQKTVAAATTPASPSTTPAPTGDCGATFMFSRRKTII